MKKQSQAEQNDKASWVSNLVSIPQKEQVCGIDFLCTADINLEHRGLQGLTSVLLRMWGEMEIGAEIRKNDNIGIGKGDADDFYLHHSGDRDAVLVATSCIISRAEAIQCVRSFRDHIGFGSPVIRTRSLEEKEAPLHTDLRPLLPNSCKDRATIVPGEELWGMDFDFLGQKLDRDLASKIGRDHCKQVTIDVTRSGRFYVLLNRMNAGEEEIFEKTLTRLEAAELLGRLCADPSFQCSYVCTRGTKKGCE